MVWLGSWNGAVGILATRKKAFRLASKLIHQDEVMRHPLLSEAPTVVLQHTDDAFIFMRACVDGAARLRMILDLFAEATGLVINFIKNTIVPVHVKPVVRRRIVEALGCTRGVFPQSYLGLPLSWEKLQFADFLPMIAKVDKYLAGWAARLLTPARRLVLINIVLDAWGSSRPPASYAFVTWGSCGPSRVKFFCWLLV
ncbi:putative gag-pol polyprotein [Hordeum vulgare]|nr:putative gag-pol polyprotein [Hordeum vulgare]